MLKKSIILLSSIIMGVTVFVTPSLAVNENNAFGMYEKIIKSTENFSFSAGNTVSDWLVYSRAISGEKSGDYLKELEFYIADEYKTDNKLGLTTEYCRFALVVNALGGNPSQVNGTFNLLNDGVFFADNLEKQGINAYIWALIAVSECKAQEPVNPENSINKMLYSLLLSELPDGGFAMSGDDLDIDITAQAIRALAPFYNNDSKIKEAVDRSVQLLFTNRNSDGSFSGFGVPCTESGAQVINALHSLYINTDEYKDTFKDKNLLKAIDFFIDDGKNYGFSHTKPETEINAFATAQGLEALTRYLMLSGVEFDVTQSGTSQDMADGYSAYIKIAIIMALIFLLLYVMDRMAKKKQLSGQKDDSENSDIQK